MFCGTLRSRGTLFGKHCSKLETACRNTFQEITNFSSTHSMKRWRHGISWGLYYNVQQGVNGKITLCIEIKARDGKLQFLGAVFKRLAVNDDRGNKNRATTTAVKRYHVVLRLKNEQKVTRQTLLLPTFCGATAGMSQARHFYYPLFVALRPGCHKLDTSTTHFLWRYGQDVTS